MQPDADSRQGVMAANTVVGADGLVYIQDQVTHLYRPVDPVAASTSDAESQRLQGSAFKSTVENGGLGTQLSDLPEDDQSSVYPGISTYPEESKARDAMEGLSNSRPVIGKMVGDTTSNKAASTKTKRSPSEDGTVVSADDASEFLIIPESEPNVSTTYGHTTNTEASEQDDDYVEVRPKKKAKRSKKDDGQRVRRTPAQIEHQALHVKAKDIGPKASLGPNRYWVGVLHHDIRPSNVKKESDMLWLKANGGTTVCTVWHMYKNQAMPPENFELFFMGKPVNKKDVMREFDAMDDRYIVFRSVEVNTIS